MQSKEDIKKALLEEARRANHPYVAGDPSTELGMIYAGNLPQIPKERMGSFTKAIAKIDNSKKADFQGFRAKTSPIGFIFSNESEAEKIPDFLSTCPVRSTSPETIRVAMLVGESNFLTLLFTVSRHAQHILILDIDPLVLAHNKFLLQCLRDSVNPTKFLDMYSNKEKNPVLKENLRTGNVSFYQGSELKHTGKDLAVDSGFLMRIFLDKIRFSFKEKYFLADNSAFYRAKTTAENLSFSFLQLDLFNEAQVRELKATLDKHKAEITLVNLTNLLFHDNDRPCRSQLGTWAPKGRFENNVKILINENAITPTLYSIYTKINSALLKGLYGETVQQALIISKLDLLVLNVDALATKYGITEDKFDVNLLFRTVAAKGTAEEMAYMIQFADFNNRILQMPDFRELVAKNPRYLLDINDCKGASGRTALHFAVIKENTGNVLLLLACADIDLDIRDQIEKKTAAEYAKGDMEKLFVRAPGHSSK